MVVVTIIAVVAALGYGVWKAGEDERRIEAFIARAAATPDLEQRRALLDRALGLDPDHELARSEKVAVELALTREADLAEAERRREEAVLIERERAKQRELQAQLEKQQAEQQLREREASDRALAAAALEQQREREAQAAALLERATRAGVERLQAISDLTDALALVPETSGELGARLAAAKVELGAALADEALGQSRAGMAEYWLGEANKLAAAAAQRERLEAIAGRIEALLSGVELFAEAKRAIGAADWLLARDKLRQALARGLDSSELQGDVALVRTRCEAEAERLLAQARAALGQGEAEQGVSLARQAAAFLDPDDRGPARELATEAARQAFQRTQAQVHVRWQRPESRPEALELLRSLAPVVVGTRFEARVEAERRDRQRMFDDPALTGLVYVPSVPELSVEAVYVMRVEVTNEDYKRFVDAGGYREVAFWDPPAHELLPQLLDETPGQAEPGPRSWIQGGYGDPANAERPVRGVSFYEARAYARWLRQETGAAWRLPSRREWEVAAGWDPLERRLQAYPWGDAFRAEALAGRPLPTPVGAVELDRSPLGVADLAGNVSEWVEERQAGGGVRPALKGAFFAAGPAQAERLASVTSTGHPGATPPRELSVSIGFRLALPTGGSR